jgi:hypothetical protein
MPQLSAVSIARPLLETLAATPFSGAIFGLFDQSCNLIDAQHRLIALTSSTIGKGPFSIVIEESPHVFDKFALHQPVLATRRDVIIGAWHIGLEHAEIWEPAITWPERPYELPPTIAALLEPYAAWPHLHSDSPLTRATFDLARQATHKLKRGLAQNSDIEAAVIDLAGLGGGLTPAGDDYLLGAMAALWLLRQTQLPPKIARLVTPRTTTLSAAFLTAAALGHYAEPWHDFVQALLKNDVEDVKNAIDSIARIGASSGADALAGFAAVMQSIPFSLCSFAQSQCRLKRNAIAHQIKRNRLPGNVFQQ